MYCKNFGVDGNVIILAPMVMRTFWGEVCFLLALMVLAEQWQCSLYANVLSVQGSVPTMFLQFLATGQVTKGRVLPFPHDPQWMLFPPEKRALLFSRSDLALQDRILKRSKNQQKTPYF